MLRTVCNAKGARAGTSLLAASVLAISTAGAQVAPAQDVTFIAAGPPCGPLFERAGVPGPGGRAAQAGPTKDAPYSGVGTTTVVRTLADGNRIVRTNTMRYARDKQGRLRTEYSLAALGPISLQDSRTIITIEDSVAQKRYTLHPEMKRADVFDLQNPFGNAASLPRAGTRVSPTIVADSISVSRDPSGATVAVAGGTVIAGEAPAVNVMEPATMAALPAIASFRMSPECGPGATGVGGKNAERPVSLGERTISGVKAIGSRHEYQIPEGAIGNEQPITVSTEQWFSPELGVVVESTHRNPLVGDTAYKLTGLSRAEPDPALFQVPGDYTVQEPMRFIERLEPPPRPRATQ